MASSVVENNLFLVNAPAGSGKTTFIRDKINEIISIDKDFAILCITYTNRAAEELLSKINSKNVIIKTIHSFISDFLNIYFSDKKIIDLYFDIYETKIQERISSTDEKIIISNQKFKDENDGKLSLEYLKGTITKIKYNELSFNSLYYGGLSHDDLLSFAEIMLDKYPILKKRISAKFKYIFIDEYQDTSANILRFFYSVVKNTTTKLFLCGDKMQQIYKNYDGTFEDMLKNFDKESYFLKNNYRSVGNIVNVLNNIYNDEQYKQFSDINDLCSAPPSLYISTDFNYSLSIIEQNNPNILKLYIFNKERFKKIGAENLFEAVSNMEKYSFGRKYGAVDVLLTNNNDNPDPLFKLLFEINDFFEKHELKQYGLLIQKIKNPKNKIYNKSILKINVHNDKITFNKLINYVYKKYNENLKIADFLIALKDENIINESIMDVFFENLEDNEYSEVLEQPLIEFKNTCKYLKEPRISTQHGVKGEGHDEVVFIAEDSRNPLVKMYGFFNLLSTHNIDYTSFESFYYEYLKDVHKFESDNSIKISELKKDTFEQIKHLLNAFINELSNKYNNNMYFNYFFSDAIAEYTNKTIVSKLTKAINTNMVFGTLIAYKLFYVGCSRAKKVLKVIVDKDKIKDYYNEFKDKMNILGFNVIE
ncbi:MAG: UvrD-helicase domain-containing protein [Candidatus Gastranaerophilales bacterium]|nr:UvrD-helicase domain-containing protein [Candidatus Gastranaerophilales bacterium]